VLLVDLRGHGGSDGGRTALGGTEHADVAAGMSWLHAAGLGRQGLGLEGHSMGAVAVLLAAAGRPDIRAVIVEAPYDSYRRSIAHHARLLYHLPEWAPLIPPAIGFAELWAGFDADEVDTVAAARRIRAPLLAIADGEDPRMPEAVVRRVHDAHPGPRRLWVAPGVGHVGAIQHPDYHGRVIGFLEQNRVP
jgi:pimeloyl-ACP methyl ester carboxylesterase